MSTTLHRPFLCFVLVVHRSGGFAMICAFTTIPCSTPGWWNRRRWACLTDRDERRETGKMLGVKRINKRSPPTIGHKLFPRVWLHTKCCRKISAIDHFKDEASKNLQQRVGSGFKNHFESRSPKFGVQNMCVFFNDLNLKRFFLILTIFLGQFWTGVWKMIPPKLGATIGTSWWSRVVTSSVYPDGWKWIVWSLPQENSTPILLTTGGESLLSSGFGGKPTGELFLKKGKPTFLWLVK